ncbi:RING finger protein 207 isoform X2 [Macaca nemestrina]|uniref:RING finger protein 207 n=1 Tax=Macaca nemestrina TaxID=9545 RepID=A0A2K6DPL9_MACNE|nr:PREDICTED: RING finger protein 207 isoform X2 [Macaca fascicularis]XP_011736052.1 RING finger protein 207 isoform X4 [Macaca nemestrina]XP_050643145.1 RING finger protein 207 isoform X7 [Macaca thibetana thibetana]
MSGAIFGPLEGPSSLDAPSVHPLVCPLCHVQYERPCLLDCFHDFCAGCLRGRATEGRLTCPLCQHQTVVKGPSGLPPVDRLLQFLVDSSGDGVEAVRCANCDLECSEQDVETTYFCNTCGQPLCARCRDETHRARMFARHDIVALGQRSRDVPQKCTLHAEPYLLFSTDKKLLLCIRCFRDMQGESRAHCVDLESAYVQGCERLEQAVLAVKALQTATREAIALLQAMVEEVRHSAAEEENAIHALFGSMQDRLAERKAVLLQAVQSQYEEKDKAFKEQLSHLATLLPTLQVHLVICSSFLSLATKAEFLDLGYELMERLQGIVTRPYRLRPVRSSKIASDHRAEFARCLEPLLLLGPRRVTAAASGANMLAGGLGPKVLTGPHCPSPVGKMSGSPVQKPTLHRSISTKVLLAEGKNTPFTEHCRHYEDTYRHLQAEMQGLKDQVQELHRDLTKHHSLIKAEIMGDVLSKSLQLDVQIASEHTSLEGMRVVFQEIWEESYQQVANEQEIYEAQLHDLLQLRQENAYLTTITKQITPYVRSIAKVKERLEPRFQAPVDEQSESLQNTHDDSRNSAASARNNPGSVPEKREKTSEPKGNSWAPNGLSEEPLLKNKDHHRSKQKNRGDIPTWREHLT